MHKLSVTIIAGAEEENIRECLESVRWADEIIVVNNFTDDRTVGIAREYTPHVFLRMWEGFASQKRYALEQATHEWVLSIDADERISPELKDEILKIISSDVTYNGFRIPRRSYFLNQWIKSCGWYPGYQLRLFRRKSVHMNDRLVHERFEVDGVIGTLVGDIIHYTHSSIKTTIQKVNEYSSLRAAEKYQKQKISTAGLIFRPFLAFLQMLIVRKGYRDGVRGVMVSLIHAITHALTMMKMWELQHSSLPGKKPQ
ncbi:MAG: glycosyltransferase family 2 protein [Bacteroidota bacterium]